jgi:hypothetical protein
MLWGLEKVSDTLLIGKWLMSYTGLQTITPVGETGSVEIGHRERNQGQALFPT